LVEVRGRGLRQGPRGKGRALPAFIQKIFFATGCCDSAFVPLLQSLAVTQICGEHCDRATLPDAHGLHVGQVDAPVQSERPCHRAHAPLRYPTQAEADFGGREKHHRPRQAVSTRATRRSCSSSKARVSRSLFCFLFFGRGVIRINQSSSNSNRLHCAPALGSLGKGVDVTGTFPPEPYLTGPRRTREIVVAEKTSSSCQPPERLQDKASGRCMRKDGPAKLGPSPWLCFLSMGASLLSST